MTDHSQPTSAPQHIHADQLPAEVKPGQEYVAHVPPDSATSQDEHFRQNLLDGDAIQKGQMLASTQVWDYITTYYTPKTERQADGGEDLRNQLAKEAVADLFTELQEQVKASYGEDSNFAIFIQTFKHFQSIQEVKTYIDSQINLDTNPSQEAGHA